MRVSPEHGKASVIFNLSSLVGVRLDVIQSSEVKVHYGFPGNRLPSMTIHEVRGFSSVNYNNVYGRWITSKLNNSGFNKWLEILAGKDLHRGLARGVLGCPWPPLGRPFFEQTTYYIQVVKTPWQYLGRKSHCWKHHFFKICFVVKYFRQQLLSLVNMNLHAAIIRLSPLIHEGEQRYKPYIVGDPRMVSLLWPPLLKNPGYAPVTAVDSTSGWKYSLGKSSFKESRL